MRPDLNISIIAAVSRNNVIGRCQDLPWHLSDDLKRFAATTKGHPVIVGRKTHEAILEHNNGPLKDRTTIVVTHQRHYRSNGCVVAHSLYEALDYAASLQTDEVFVIGGESLYREAFRYAKCIYLTKVHVFCKGDAYFPEFRTTDWNETDIEFHPQDARNQYDYTYSRLLKKN